MTNDNPTPPPAEPNGQPAYGGTPAGYPQQQPYPPAPPAYGAPAGYPGQQYGGYGAPATDPGKTMGIVGLVLSIAGLFFWFVAPIAGIIVSAIGRSKSKKAGFNNVPGLWGIIIGIVVLVLNILFILAIISLIAVAASTYGELCATLGPGVHEYSGQEITCP